LLRACVARQTEEENVSSFAAEMLLAAVKLYEN
jgi:hypothetical protein